MTKPESRSVKGVLAENPLELVVGGGVLRPPPKANSGVLPAPAVPESRHDTRNQPPVQKQLVEEEGRVEAIPSTPVELPDSSATGAEPSSPRSKRPRESTVESASLRHRMGTMKAPYSRADGVKVRQWAITLPVDTIRRIHHLAIDRGARPAELALEAIEQYLAAARPAR